MKTKRQAGFLSIEAMIVLFVAMAGMMLGFQWLQADSDVKVNRATAEHATTFTDATAKWMKDNYSAINAAANPLAQYTDTAVASYLPSTFTTTNPYGQSYSIRVYKAAANQLQAMIVTTGGETIGEQSIRKIAQLIGAKGGFVSSADTTKAQGSYGGWNMPFSNFGSSPGAGKLATALFFQDGALVSDYLYRNAVAGHPELNQMNTAIDMNGNNVNNAGQVNTNTVAATSNVTAGGNVTATGNVNAANANISGETTTGGWFRNTGDNGWYNQKWNGGWYMSDSTWVRSYADKNVYTGGQMRAGMMKSDGRLMTGEFAQIDGYAVEGGACPGGNMIAVDANTKLTLSCQSGVWIRQSVCPYWTGDLNWLQIPAGSSGCVNGVALGNAPTGDWFFVETIRHPNSGNYYVTQRATGMTGGAAGTVWIRSQQSSRAGSGWSAWAIQTRAGGWRLTDGAPCYDATYVEWIPSGQRGVVSEYLCAAGQFIYVPQYSSNAG